MIQQDQFIRVAASLPFLAHANPELVRQFRDYAFLAEIPPGRDVFLEGDRIDAIPVLISGVVRVYQIGETGREVTLYRFRPGESCVLSANAILSQESFPAIATVEERAEAVMIPADMFREWVGRFDIWRDFFIDLVSQRIARLMQVVDEVAFQRLDRRVAALLLDRMSVGSPIPITHQEIAAELGSSREVISRLLEDFSSREMIRTARGQIEVLNATALEQTATA
jgi:CRP/FNR family transcriptional regulator